MVFRKKVIETEQKRQKEASDDEETLSDEKQTEKKNRKLLESIISNLITDQTKADQEPDVYEAYQIILSEHYKTSKKQGVKIKPHRKSQKRMFISSLKIDGKEEEESLKKNSQNKMNEDEKRGKPNLNRIPTLIRYFIVINVSLFTNIVFS